MSDLRQYKFRSMICASGYSRDVIIRAMQKYFHKRQPAEMFWCAVQLYDLGLAEGRPDEDKQKGKAVLTHLWNRLIVLLDEDIVFDECVLYNGMRDRIDKLSDGSYNIEALQEICVIMCGAKMIQLNNDICSYWENYTVKHIGTDRFIAKPGDTPELIADMNVFISAIEEKSPIAYGCALKIFHYKDIKSAHRYRRPEPIYAVWEYILSLPMHTDIKRTLEYRLKEFHKKDRKERKIFLTSAISIVIHSDSIVIDSIYKMEDLKTLYDFVIDDSVDEIVNEDKRYFMKDWRETVSNHKVSKKKK